MECIAMSRQQPTKTPHRAIPVIAAAGMTLLAVIAPAPARADQLEQTYWSMISTKQDAHSFENYLKRFPEGEHAEEARQRIAELTGAPAAQDSATAPATSAATAPAAVPAMTLAQMKALLEQAVTAQSGGDYRAAAELYAQAAEAGSRDAHMHLGYLYEMGDGVAKDSEKALEHYQAAGKLGDLEGYVAGIYLMTGKEPSRAAELILALSRVDADKAVSVLENVMQATLAALQQRLADEGYYTSTIDGVTGPGTRSALAAYADAGRATPVSVAANAGLIVTHSGVGGITSQTPYDADALRQALPGYDLEIKRISAEGVSEMYFIVRKDGRDVMRIEGMDGRVSAIRLSGDGIADERGMEIGHSKFMDFKGRVERACTIQEEQDAAVIMCQSDDDAILYFFSSPEPVFPDADGALRRSSVPRSSPLTEIMWYPTG